MKLPAKLAFVALAVVALGVFAANRFLNAEPRLTIKLHGSNYSEAILSPGFGPLQDQPVKNNTATFPVAYGKQFLQLRRADGSSLWLFYSHLDVGLRRFVEVRIDSIDAETGKATLRYNGFENNAVTFKFRDHETEEQALSLHGP